MKAGEYMEKRKDKEAWIWNVAVHHYITHQLSAYVPEILELPEDHLFDSSYASKLPEEIYDLLLKQLQSEDTQAM
jgi:hypothetical protein